MRTLLTLGANSNTARRHGSGQNNENITNTRGKLEHSTYFVHFHVFVECSSLSLELVMFSLFVHFHVFVEGSSLLLALVMFLSNSNTPRRHGSGQNNENITNTRGKLELSTKTWKWTNNENITNSRDKLEH
jgi:hypothetical protein